MKILLAILILAASQVNAQKSRVAYTYYLDSANREYARGYGRNTKPLVYTNYDLTKYSFRQFNAITWPRKKGYNWENVSTYSWSPIMAFASDLDSITVTNLTPYKKHGIVTRTIYKKPE